MQLGDFSVKDRAQGDQLPAKQAVDRVLIGLVREYRSQVKTQYKPDGAPAIVLDVADVIGDSVWCDVLWMGGAVVDQLADWVATPVPFKLAWTPSQSGGNPFIAPVALEGNELAAAQQWAAQNPDRFEQERASRGLSGPQGDAQPAPGPVPQQAAPPPQTATQAPPDPNDPTIQALVQQVNSGQTG